MMSRTYLMQHINECIMKYLLEYDNSTMLHFKFVFKYKIIIKKYNRLHLHCSTSISPKPFLDASVKLDKQESL